VNDAKRFGDYAKLRNSKIFSNLHKNDKNDSLVYGIYGYSEDLAETYDDTLGSLHTLQLLDGHMMEIQSMVHMVIQTQQYSVWCHNYNPGYT
jgi:hypothetical protein